MHCCQGPAVACAPLIVLSTWFQARNFVGKNRASAALQQASASVLSEALANVRLHAGARRVELLLESDDAEGRLTVDDDGVGLPPNAGDGRYGLVGMRERAAALGGTCAIAARAGGGTRVRVCVPIAS